MDNQDYFLRALLQPMSDSEAKRAAATHLDALIASRRGGDRGAVARAERAVAEDPHSAFDLDPSGVATLHCDGASWVAGRFETPTVGDLEAALRAKGSAGVGMLRLSVLTGASPLTDIGWLQASAPPRTLFQVAPQFNCLESPGRYLVPVRDYFGDATQGPRAAIGAFPATLLRHYFAPAPDEGRFTQVTDGRQIELLAAACGRDVAPNGYLTGGDIDSPEGFAERLEGNAPHLRVGVHDEAQVVLGYDWDGGPVSPEAPRIAHVLTSTAAGGWYGARSQLGDEVFHRIARQLLRAAYLGTLLAAASLKKQWVVLTLIGGGVFANPHPLIWDSIVWALDRTEPLLGHDMHVVLNARGLSRSVDMETVVLPEVTRRGGRLCHMGAEGVRERLG